MVCAIGLQQKMKKNVAILCHKRAVIYLCICPGPGDLLSWELRSNGPGTSIQTGSSIHYYLARKSRAVDLQVLDWASPIWEHLEIRLQFQ